MFMYGRSFRPPVCCCLTCCIDVILLTLLSVQSSAPHVQAHGVCALFPAFLLFVGRFAGSIMWTKVPFSRDIVSWRQNHVVLLQNRVTTNWFVAACESSEAVSLLSQINRCLDHLTASQTALSATFDAFCNPPQLRGASAEAVQLGKSLDSTRLPHAAFLTRPSAQGDSNLAVLPETLLFGEHRYLSVHVFGFKIEIVWHRSLSTIRSLDSRCIDALLHTLEYVNGDDLVHLYPVANSQT
jgi:hypothetical protein